MTVPLMVLAFFSFTIGFINVPAHTPIFSGFLGIQDYEFKHFLEASVPSITGKDPLWFNVLLATIAVAIAGFAISLSHRIYAGSKAVQNAQADTPERTDPLDSGATKAAWRFANAKMYWDETYFRFIVNPYNRLGKFLYEVVDWKFLHDYFHDEVMKKGYDSFGKLLANPFDLGIIDGFVNGVGTVVKRASASLRTIQTGYVRMYAVVLLFGVVAVLVMLLLPLFTQAR
jgi:NADH-quinone oxidoreductase subunit L